MTELQEMEDRLQSLKIQIEEQRMRETNTIGLPINKEALESTMKWLYELDTREHMRAFRAIKQFTKETMITEVKKFEGQYMEMKEKTAIIDEFIKMDLQ